MLRQRTREYEEGVSIELHHQNVSISTKQNKIRILGKLGWRVRRNCFLVPVDTCLFLHRLMHRVQSQVASVLQRWSRMLLCAIRSVISHMLVDFAWRQCPPALIMKFTTAVL